MHAHFLWPPRRKGSKENATRNSPSKCRVGLERAERELEAPQEILVIVLAAAEAIRMHFGS